MANTDFDLQSYYERYLGENKFWPRVVEWLGTLEQTTVRVAGKEYEMTLTRYMKRFEKACKSEINLGRREKRKRTGYTQPAMSTRPLHTDLKFLKVLKDIADRNEKWKSNEDDTVRTLVSGRWWCKRELEQLILMQTIRQV